MQILLVKAAANRYEVTTMQQRLEQGELAEPRSRPLGIPLTFARRFCMYAELFTRKSVVFWCRA